MNKFTRFILILIFLQASLVACLGTGEIWPDSILSQLETIPTPEDQVDSLNEWAWEFRVEQPMLAISLADSALVMATEHAYLKGQGDAYSRLGYIYRFSNMYPEAIDAYQLAFDIRDSLGNPGGAAGMLSALGKVCIDNGNGFEARVYLKRALDRFTALNIVLQFPTLSWPVIVGVKVNGFGGNGGLRQIVVCCVAINKKLCQFGRVKPQS